MSSALTFTGSYIPEDDLGLRSWVVNFATTIKQNPSRFGVSEADATIIMNHSQSYSEALDVTQSPSTRTPSAIQWKDAVKASAVASLRIYAQLIRSNMGVCNDDLVALRLNPRNNSRSPVPRPRSAPLIAVRAAFPQEHSMTYCDENTPTSRRKPPGVKYLDLRWRVLEPGVQVTQAMLDPAKMNKTKLITKTPFFVQHDSADAGKTVVYLGRWVTGTGLSGPWSPAVWFTIAAGGDARESLQGGGEKVESARTPKMAKAA